MKTFSFKIDALTGEEFLEVYIRGRQLLNDPLLNKGSGFTREERLAFGLEGYLRSGFSSMEVQVERTLEAYRRKPDAMERYIFLNSLLDRSEPLFYRLLCDNLTEMVPIVYTPTVGQACLELSHIQRRFRGVYVSPENIDRVDQIFQSLSRPHVSLIVVTDGERILGLGDLGSDGMGIPVGKVSLYVAAGGLHPAVCLPVCLDIGTNNERLLADPLYLGYRHRRLEGEAYEEIVERFVLGVKRNFPDALLQWEDFAKNKALHNLARYRERILSFNDDIQGTGAAALAALMTAMRIKEAAFHEQRFVVVGMGQAGSGICYMIRTMLRQGGLSEEEARRRLFALDVQGLLLEDDPALEPQQKMYAQPRAAVECWRLQAPSGVGLLDVVRNAKPTVLIGVTAQRGLFSAEILEEVARNTDRPVVMALSNPTSRTECTPEELARATNGQGLLATGSPFPPLEWNGRTIKTSQGNNLFVFPGVGLGALVSKASKVTDGMFLAAARAISAMVTPGEEEQGLLLPDMEAIREVSARVATAVAIEARDTGLGRLIPDSELESVVRKAQWEPRFSPYRPGPAAVPG
jgi:malate dehydrogenase (oxaloacetate-decarboxylating)